MGFAEEDSDVKPNVPLVLVCLSFSVLAACGGGDAKESASGADNSDGSLLDYFGGSDPATQQARFQRQQQIAEQKIAKCMRAEGFQYSVYVPKNSFPIVEQPKRGGEVAFKRKRGYGFATNMNPFVSAQEDVNPNNKMLEKMTETEQNAYSKALYGPSTPGEPQSSTPTGCQAAAYQDQADAYKPLESKFTELQKRIEADKQLVALNAKFVSCMKKVGYPINKEQDLYEKLLNPKYMKIMESMSAGQPQGAEAAVSDAGPPPVPTLPAAKVQEMKEFELKVANADADCRPQRDVDVAFEITQRYEATFIQENKVLLDQLKLAQK